MKFLPKYTNRDSLSVIKYLNDIYKIPLLTCEEEIELGLKAKEGDEKAIEKLVKSNLRFVISIAKQYQTPQHDLSTLISEGNLGLIKAAQKFDPTKGFKFLSYAVWWIRQSIQDWIYNKGKIIQLPFPKGLLLKNVKKEINMLISDTIGPIAKLDKIQFVTGLPKTRSGKIMRRILRKIAEGDFSNFGDTSTLLNPEIVDEIKNERIN